MSTADQAHTMPVPGLHNVVRFPEARLRQPGPVTLAIAAIRAPEAPMPPEWEADLAAGREALALLRTRAKARLREDIALLDTIGWDHPTSISPAGDL